MKVSELISALSQHDPEAVVLVPEHDLTMVEAEDVRGMLACPRKDNVFGTFWRKSRSRNAVNAVVLS